MGFEIKDRDAETITLAMYWELVFPQYPVPNEGYLHGWLKRTSLEDVMALLDQLKPRKFDNAEHLGKVISSMIRQIATGELVKTYPDSQ
jgi:hypothetical protein